MAKGDKKKAARRPKAKAPANPKTSKPARAAKRAPAATATPKAGAPAPTKTKAAALPPTDREIRERALKIWEARKGGPGSAQGDWLEAERQLRSERGL